MDLPTLIKNAKSVFKPYVSRLERLEIFNLWDLLYYIPFRYNDYSLISKTTRVQAGEVVTVQGTILEIKNEFTKNYKKLQKATIKDDCGTIEAVWFNQPFIPKILRKGDWVSLAGRVGFFARKLIFESPEYEVIQDKNPTTIHTGRLVPVYNETQGVSSKWLRRQIYKLIIEEKSQIIEYIPDSIIKSANLMALYQAIEQIHFPKSFENAHKARQRLAFDELFLLQMAAFERKREWNKNLRSHIFSVASFKKEIEQFWNQLPFTLTQAQKKAVRDIFKDLASQTPMNRLLEGDVGSGKTVVSAIAMYLAYLNGFQSTLMAPTEILAQQHYNTIHNLLSPLGVKVGLVTGSKKFQISNSCLPAGRVKFQILIGTHALLAEKIKFEKLGLVVIDEQQRFGVEQRAIIRSKGESPHLLTMTATPIPRTIALTMYGNLDLSYLDELPKGREIIKTWLVPSEKRNAAYEWIEKELKKHASQAFIICPFIEESESMQTVKAAKKEFEILQKEVFPNLKLALLHGKQKAKEKDTVLQAFRNKEFDILVATPVVEVGIDIANATIIVIEAAERFGLSQLHQLRGRVGRGDKQSYCLLFSESLNTQTTKRLKAMETTNIGAELAELDLKLRGAGELYGTKQHGSNSLKIANFSDALLITLAKNEAEKIFPHITSYPLLLEKLKKITPEQVSPD